MILYVVDSKNKADAIKTFGLAKYFINSRKLKEKCEVYDKNRDLRNLSTITVPEVATFAFITSSGSLAGLKLAAKKLKLDPVCSLKSSSVFSFIELAIQAKEENTPKTDDAVTGKEV